jgi:4-amino-4-deoxy-L-arabinose transferase-like glycosyltransferase
MQNWPGYLADLLLFGLLFFGLGFPFASRLKIPAIEKLLVTWIFSAALIFIAGWSVFAFGLSRDWLLALPAIALFALFIERHQFILLIRDERVIYLLRWQGIVSGVCVAWLVTIKFYSGGTWYGDWIEHWMRSLVVLREISDEALFFNYPFTSRPPLANTVVASFLGLTGVQFPKFQLFMCLFGTLAFAPAAIMARQDDDDTAIPVLTGLLLVNPMFIQNTTYSWTRMPTAFFVISAAYFFLKSLRPETQNRTYFLMSCLSLGLGMLTHYSTAPYALTMFLVAGAVVVVSRLRQGNHHENPGFILLGFLVTCMTMAPWFLWAVWRFGTASTFLANTSVQDASTDATTQLSRVVMNIRDTFVPWFLRAFDTTAIQQVSLTGALRDKFFMLYQFNLLFAFGCVAWVCVVAESKKVLLTKNRAERLIWVGTIGLIIALGIAVHGGRDPWGLAHICLQPLVFAGLAFLARRARTLPSALKNLLIAGAAFDFMFGVLLQNSVQSMVIELWGNPGLTTAESLATYSRVTQSNFALKDRTNLEFIGDSTGWYVPAAVLLMIAVLALGSMIPLTRRMTANPKPSISKDWAGRKVRDDE